MCVLIRKVLNMQQTQNNFNVLPIPDRWLNCPRKGQIIAGKFLPFKTPLDARYNGQIPEESRFDLELLFNSLRSSPMKLGLIIDLTNTRRFYNSEEVERYGCKYVKLQCKGRDETPTDEQTKAFVEMCETFVRNDPLRIIGVHCTHGFNRTGFLISSYLIDKVDWSVDAAVREYSRCRPPGIYKQEYLRELFGRFGELDETPEAPPLPDWCNETIPCDESEDAPDEQQTKKTRNGGNSNNHNNRSNDVVKKNAKFMDGAVPSVTTVYASRELQYVRYAISGMCGCDKDNSFPGAQPVSMDCENISLLSQMPFKVSWKADGTRYMMLIDVVDGKNKVYMIDRDNTVFNVPNLCFPQRKNLDLSITSTLLDGEMIIDTDNNDKKQYPRYLIYDIVKFMGIDVGNTDFERRLLCINKEIVGARNDKCAQGKLDKSKEPFSVRAKEFYDLSVAKNLVDSKFTKQVSHETDGLIFQPITPPYKAGRCIEMLKWKPPDMNSIDFKLQIVQEQKQGCLKETKGYLMVLHSNLPFSTIKVTPDLKQMNNKIIECRFDFSSRSWKFMRERTDKSFPNSVHTAKGVWKSIERPVTTKVLFDWIDSKRWKLPSSASAPSSSSSFKPPASASSSTTPSPVRPPNGNEGRQEERGLKRGVRAMEEERDGGGVAGENEDLMPPPNKLPHRV